MSPAANASFAPLVLDALPADGLRRVCHGLDHAQTPVALSGSAQFDEAGLGAVLARWPGALIVDLRRESHGFVDGRAVSWYAENNWGAVGLSTAEAVALEAARLRLLAGASTVPVGTKATALAGAPAPHRWAVGRVSAERALVEAAGARYLRWPLDDHCGPDAEAVASFFEHLASLPADQHVHLHCRGGKGRTSTAMAMLDMVRTGLAYPAVRARQLERNGYDLERLPEPTRAKFASMQARRAFLRRFPALIRRRAGGPDQRGSSGS